MAEKKKIKGIKDNSGSADSSGLITVTDLNPPPTGTPPSADETFQQAGYKSLCFNIGDIINTKSVTIPGTSTSVITTARRIQRGTVLATVTNNSGTIEENKSLKVIKFFQPNLSEMKIMVGSEVRYDLVLNLTTGIEMAVNVEILM